METRARAACAALVLAGLVSALGQAQQLLRTYVGDGTVGRGLGQALAPAGDVDGDGVGDLIAAYRQGVAGQPFGAGVVQVLSGRTVAVLHTWVGAAPGDALGRSVAAAGDVDGDGHADLLIGAPGVDLGGSDAGEARVVSGRDGSILLRLAGPFARARFGWSVAGLGDVDGDGRPDLAISGQPDPGTPQPAGFVRIHSGADGALLRELVGASAASRLGCSIAAAGDVDGDGVVDLVAGDWRDATTAIGAGAVRVWSGADGQLLHVFHGDGSQDQLGLHVAGAGDLDGDGHADLLASSPFADGALKDVGLARAWSGADGSVLYSVYGDFPFDFFGAAVCGVGDADGDGRDDFLVGAFADDDGGPNSGRARVYSGIDGVVVFELDGDSGGDELGFAVTRAGDVDGDGGLDFAVSAPVDDAGGGPLSGSVRVWAGVPPAPSGPQVYCVSAANSAGPGAHMSWSGTTSVAAKDLVLHADGAVPRSLGLFLASPREAQLSLLAGTLCVAPPVARLAPFLRIDESGSVSRPVVPRRRGRPLLHLGAGETWCFQLAYLDLGRRGLRRLSFSDGLRVTFTP